MYLLDVDISVDEIYLLGIQFTAITSYEAIHYSEFLVPGIFARFGIALFKCVVRIGITLSYSIQQFIHYFPAGF
jgi:hypothetical protein